MAKTDYYQTLGVGKNASPEEIKSAYRKLALEWHPDRHAQDKKKAEEKFKEINEAYQVLSDPQKKSTYDQFGSAAFENGGMGQGPFGQGQNYQQGPFTYTYYTGGGGPEGFDFGGFNDPFEIFEQFFGGSSPFGSRGRSARQAYQMRISFLEAVKGVEKEVSVEGKKTKIKIPAGVDTGSRVRFGNFDLVLEVTPSAKFKREGDDLIVEAPVSFAQAALGAEVFIDTLEGKERIKIHSGTQPNTLIRLRGKGVTHVRGGGRGDLYVRVKLTIPSKLSARQKELLRELEKNGGEKRGWF
ncbi:DnaJ domain-containing protein [Candidatus Microgenomates bacterium]|nr:DnaJ domain-containing protein [Candidatus Microgenomates bacterium]